MRKFILTIFVFAFLAGPAWAADAGETATSGVVDAGGIPSDAAKVSSDAAVSPTTIAGAIEVGKAGVAAAKDGRWWYFASLVVTLIMFLLKFIGIRVGFWAALGRWRYVISPLLSISAALLAAFQGGVSFDIAIGVLTSAYATSSLQEFWEHGVLGKPRASAG